jgi:hypothetical protein
VKKSQALHCQDGASSVLLDHPTAALVRVLAAGGVSR